MHTCVREVEVQIDVESLVVEAFRQIDDVREVILTRDRVHPEPGDISTVAENWDRNLTSSEWYWLHHPEECPPLVLSHCLLPNHDISLLLALKYAKTTDHARHK
jgi:hypothetical protein